MTKRKRFDSTATNSAIAVFEDELKRRSDGYVEHLSHGGKADCGEEFYLDALYMAITSMKEQEERNKGCVYCDIAKANEGVINRALWVKESETHRWTMAGKRLSFCPMCGRKLKEGDSDGR